MEKSYKHKVPRPQALSPKAKDTLNPEPKTLKSPNLKPNQTLNSKSSESYTRDPKPSAFEILGPKPYVPPSYIFLGAVKPPLSRRLGSGKGWCGLPRACRWSSRVVGFRKVGGLGLEVWGLGLSGLAMRAWGLGFKAWGLGFRVEDVVACMGFGFRVGFDRGM